MTKSKLLRKPKVFPFIIPDGTYHIEPSTADQYMVGRLNAGNVSLMIKRLKEAKGNEKKPKLYLLSSSYLWLSRIFLEPPNSSKHIRNYYKKNAYGCIEYNSTLNDGNKVYHHVILNLSDYLIEFKKSERRLHYEP